MSETQPPGFTMYRTDDGIPALLVPDDVAAEAIEARLRRRELEAEDRRKAEEMRRAEAAAAPPKAEPVAPQPEAPAPAWDASPRDGFFRVLPRFAEQVGPQAAAQIQTNTVDADAQKRQERLRKRLLELGPDRRIGRVERWPKQLEDLEVAMPNFARPIAMLRDVLTLAEAAGNRTRTPPMLVLGPPGVGKTCFSHGLAQMLGVPDAAVSFDQPTGGSQLRGSDKYWSNTEAGILFKLVCLGEVANPLILLDEIDKAVSGTSQDIDALAQLHGALEPQTARCLQDISTDIEFDASLVGYVATANSLRGIGAPLLSRFEIFAIGPLGPHEAVQVARHVIDSGLRRLGLQERVRFERRCAYVLAHMSPRLMQRSVELLAAAALREKVGVVREDDALRAVGWDEDGPRLH